MELSLVILLLWATTHSNSITNKPRRPIRPAGLPYVVLKGQFTPIRAPQPPPPPPPAPTAYRESPRRGHPAPPQKKYPAAELQRGILVIIWLMCCGQIKGRDHLERVRLCGYDASLGYHVKYILDGQPSLECEALVRIVVLEHALLDETIRLVVAVHKVLVAVTHAVIVAAWDTDQVLFAIYQNRPGVVQSGGVGLHIVVMQIDRVKLGDLVAGFQAEHGKLDRNCVAIRVRVLPEAEQQAILECVQISRVAVEFQIA